ncbi:unnamed protein product, partial [Tuber aestivum]
GCGKSVLCATAIEDIKHLCSTNDDHALAYFYFTFSDSGKQNLPNMLLSLIGQLAEEFSGRDLPDEVIDLYLNSKAVRKSPDINALKSAFSQMIKLYKRVFVILDALDEFPKSTRGSLLSLISGLTLDNNAGSLSILVTSRPEADIVCSLEPVVAFSISLHSQTIDLDIRSYIQKSLDGRDGFRGFTKEIKSEIEETLVVRSQGMFRWVDCLLRILEECITPEDVRESLKELPEDLDSVYLRILDSIPKKQKEYIWRVLHWLAFSAEPLTLGQLAEAILIEFNVNKYGDDPGTLFDMASLMSICPSLISFEDSRDHETCTQERLRLHLAHFSVKEYLISDRAAQGPSAYYHISEHGANLLMGHACLSRILRHSEQNAISGPERQEATFLYHSARYWSLYIEALGETVPTPLSDAVLKVLELGRVWLDIYDPDDHYHHHGRRGSSTCPPPIYYSSMLGLVIACKSLLNRTEDTVNANAKGGVYGNALQAAVVGGRESIVRFLLDRGASVNAQGGHYGNALQGAAFRGNESVVQLLLESGAEVSARGGYYGNALQAAAYRGNLSVVQLLLERGAEVNARDGLYGNALQAAVVGGRESIVRFLLDRGASVNARGGHYGNALQAAIVKGNGVIVEFLLGCGAEVNARGGHYGNALQAAARMGNESALRHLLERGAEVNAHGGQYGNALQAAVEGGNESIAQLLFVHGA